MFPTIRGFPPTKNVVEVFDTVKQWFGRLEKDSENLFLNLALDDCEGNTLMSFLIQCHSMTNTFSNHGLKFANAELQGTATKHDIPTFQAGDDWLKENNDHAVIMGVDCSHTKTVHYMNFVSNLLRSENIGEGLFVFDEVMGRLDQSLPIVKRFSSESVDEQWECEQALETIKHLEMLEPKPTNYNDQIKAAWQRSLEAAEVLKKKMFQIFMNL